LQYGQYLFVVFGIFIAREPLDFSRALLEALKGGIFSLHPKDTTQEVILIYIKFR